MANCEGNIIFYRWFAWVHPSRLIASYCQKLPLRRICHDWSPCHYHHLDILRNYFGVHLQFSSSITYPFPCSKISSNHTIRKQLWMKVSNSRSATDFQMVAWLHSPLLQTLNLSYNANAPLVRYGGGYKKFVMGNPSTEILKDFVET